MEVFTLEEWEKNFDELFLKGRKWRDHRNRKGRWAGSSNDACG